jgi:hypothetical protein
MIYGTRLSVKTGKPIRGYLRFDTGKKVSLSKHERGEFEAWVRSRQVMAVEQANIKVLRQLIDKTTVLSEKQKKAFKKKFKL